MHPDHDFVMNIFWDYKLQTKYEVSIMLTVVSKLLPMEKKTIKTTRANFMFDKCQFFFNEVTTQLYHHIENG